MPSPASPDQRPPQCWDIFCNVIDNFGDIGVCWRLARQLANEYGATVRLWVDDLTAFLPLCPAIDPSRPVQSVSARTGAPDARVEIHLWPATDFPMIAPGDVVIEAFACRLPASFEAAMAACPRKPVWINLDYLSAEDWVAGCHALPSPHPRLPLTKYFFFPGFDAQTGGLLRESDLIDARDAFRRAPAERLAFWQQLGFPMPAADTLTLTLFAYDNPALPTLLEAWAKNRTPVCCLLPPTRTQAAVEAWLGHPLLPGESVRRGMLEIRAVPFVSQTDYDRLLWLGDMNFVRGEDSFVRAQWAGTPFVWHIYPQNDGAHRSKLDAFLGRFEQGLSPKTAFAVHELHNAWNGFAPNPMEIGAAWRNWLEALPEIREHAGRWQNNLQKQEDLCASLVRFCRSKL